MTRTKLIAYSALMCALLIVSTLWFKFNIPGTGVLFTTQVLFVLLCGQILPPVACLAAIGAYLALGLLGVPVFSATQGLAVMASPSFGYLLGFPVAAVLTAAVRRKLSQGKAGAYAASLAGLVGLYAVALPYIALLNALYLGKPIPFAALVSGYCLAFLPLDLIKGLLAAFFGERLRKAKVL